ncbi:uncharacterized protein LOC144036453 [Vanacampus margaritifer]
MPTHVGLSQSDASASHDVLESYPLDDMNKISQYPECSAGPSRQNPKPESPPEVDSDSGDSLFLTQLPLPQARRRVRRRKSSRHTFVTELEDSGEDASSSYSDDDDHEMSGKKKKKGKIKLPKYSFSFLTERTWKPRCTVLTTKQNLKFTNYVMGGFFKCVELWQGAEDLHDGLPTVDRDDENISPLTVDEEEDKSGDEDIKVVEKKLFLAKSKAKWQQPWYTPPQCAEQHQEGNGVVTPETASNEVTRSHIANTPRPEGNSGDVTSKQMKENIIQENVLVSFELDISMKEDAMCSLNQDELMKKTIQREVEEHACNISKPLNGEKQRKKKKKKRSHPEPGNLDTTAVPQKAAKRKKKKFLEDDISGKSSSDVAPLNGSIEKKKKSSCISERVDVFDTPDETRHVADGTEKMTEDNVVGKKKKKKKSSRTMPEVGECVSEVEKTNIRTSSFLVADVAESSTSKKKKKRHKNKSYCETEDTLPVETGESGELNSSLNQAHYADSCHGSATFDNDRPGSDTLNDLKDKKKKKKRKKQLTNQAELEGMLLCDEGLQM